MDAIDNLEKVQVHVTDKSKKMLEHNSAELDKFDNMKEQLDDTDVGGD